MNADTIIRGPIYTADGNGSFAEAMAIRNGKILAVGYMDDMLPFMGSKSIHFALHTRMQAVSSAAGMTTVFLAVKDLAPPCWIWLSRIYPWS